MTEEEAKTKWCPHARVDGCNDVQNSYNRYSSGDWPDEAKCLASDCMMWKWDEYTYIHDFTDGSKNEKVVSDEDGHCRLTG